MIKYLLIKIYRYFVLILACHQRGVIHRDIKDENLLVTISPHSKPKIELIDFGSGAHIGVNEIYFDFDGKFQTYSKYINMVFHSK